MNRNQGNLLVFEIIEGVREWIQTNIIDLILQQKEQAVEKQKIIYHRPTFDTYTPCTIENFLVWKAKFDDELNKLKVKQQKEEELRLSGKQFFLKNKGEIKEPEPEEEEEEEEDEDYDQQEDAEYEEFKK
ncbi:rWD repeat protein [Ichthyophthirius multifiliis]|uniref:RWD repeat protein n=1 Tax=Ichthyophthirius multifiliis TaxID=5932 RepID=G0QW61_ICHMU|nr:rWD repeat protein [Ichthyophthirius multifiliis]EGR30542.1 rWD repeat protein [Ichthyophthirius multifiliis]|eukprot:XP_004032129.1 rWD repeat protein [Ichthyophthirius multifiliis]